MSGSGCGCCSCLSGAGPHVGVANRPGLASLHARIGTHGSILESMIARLSGEPELHALTTRERDDPAVALLDGWAMVGDVLTFYQERILNEGYLRTATERRSVVELGRLVGYAPKPGVAASVYVAYTIEDAAKASIPAGSKVQTIPGPKEEAQTFETSAPLEADWRWNALKARSTFAQSLTAREVIDIDELWVAGTDMRFAAGEALLFTFRGDSAHAIRYIVGAEVDRDADRTRVDLQPVDLALRMVHEVILAAPVEVFAAAAPPAGRKRRGRAAAEPAAPAGDPAAILSEIRLGATAAAIVERHGHLPIVAVALAAAANATNGATQGDDSKRSFERFLEPLIARRAVPPVSPWSVGRDLTLRADSDLTKRLLTTFHPVAATTLHSGVANLAFQQPAELISVEVLHKRAAPFGFQSPGKPTFDREKQTVSMDPYPLIENPGILHLDAPADDVRAGSRIVIERDGKVIVTAIRAATPVTRSDYGFTAKTTRLELASRWFDPNDDDEFNVLPRTTILLGSEEIPLARLASRPLRGPFPRISTELDLDVLLEDFSTGRWVIVTGERDDTPGTTGVIASEPALVVGVRQDRAGRANDRSRSVLLLAPEGLKFTYRRETVTIHANVVKATHGTTTTEIFGDGNALQAAQSFRLRHPPLTFVPAATPEGAASTLEVRVNEVEWHATESFLDADPRAHVYVTRISGDGAATVTFGNGIEGSRLPTGSSNVRGTYRYGIGPGGNVRAEQIKTALDRPLGVKDVINPLPATGGAGPESIDDARGNIPIALQALGRVVSLRDYADFARTFAGIAKATARRLVDGRRQIVHLTVGGADEGEIAESSDLYLSLIAALELYGDPIQPFLVQSRETVVAGGRVRVRVHPDYLWTEVAPRVRAALIDAFGYPRRDFGQPLFPSEVVAAVQRVDGVDWVDLDDLHGTTLADVIAVLNTNATAARVEETKPIFPQPARPPADSDHDFLPAQIVCVVGDRFDDTWELTEFIDE